MTSSRRMVLDPAVCLARTTGCRELGSHGQEPSPAECTVGGSVRFSVVMAAGREPPWSAVCWGLLPAGSCPQASILAFRSRLQRQEEQQPPPSPPQRSEIFTPAHEENVRFIYEAWQGVERDLRSQMSGSERGLVEEYVEKVPNPSLKTFKPIDLSDLKRRNTTDAKKS
ncbi:hypothetical protein PANDA_000705 [Ailuropoda melanoleuca]|uniref:MAPK regulated corepressor interacting protein 1 n=1 Tax=Ailuropoda melanoleuca TaxID=9646 RepID=D2GVF6_AILME|nr:hypothetical protein PANDA_000705 [Ailuropoda melanoleuca]